VNLKGTIAIVTGGNSGIGQSVVMELAKQGANIVNTVASRACL
jgi:glucose 1-dehydrogenase